MLRRDMLRFFLRPQGPAGDVIVVVFLRGGVDGLNLVVPREDREYFRLRPMLAIRDSVDLDGRFGLHPSLAPLMPLYRAGSLAVVHATGSDDATRSHFEAQDQMEHGCGCGDRPTGGWIGRYLRARPGGAPAALGAVAIGAATPEAFRGGPGSVTMTQLDDVQLDFPDTGILEAMYGVDDAVGAAGRETIAMVRTVTRLQGEVPREGYPDHEFARGLRDVARLIRAEVGLEAAALDLDGWDTHFFQPALLGDLAGTLSTSLAAFAGDLGPLMDRVTLVCLTEFGRRAGENASFGTDHGRGSVAFVLGGGVAGGRVVTEWPGLEDLEGPGDLRVTIDYRDVLAEVLRKRGGDPDLSRVFPGYAPVERGLLGS